MKYGKICYDPSQHGEPENLMYLDFFQFNERPFKLNSDYKFLYESKGHRAALDLFNELVTTEENVGVITGEIGAGKTTVCHAFLATLSDSFLVAKIHQTQLTSIEFLQMLLLEFGENLFLTTKIELIEKLTEFLVTQKEKDQKILLVVDEAQNLEVDVLLLINELVQLRSSDGFSLINVILIGQPEFNNALDTRELADFRKKIKLIYHLAALNKYEIREYIAHRLKVAGLHHKVDMRPDTIPLVYLYTGGRARLINVLCDHSLLAAYVENQHVITGTIIEAAIDELQWVPFGMEPTGKIFKFGESTLSDKEEYSLELMSGKKIVKTYPINTKRLHIGRHSDNDIQLKSDKVSRQHAIIIHHEDCIYIRDMNSKNGCYVNRKRIDMQELHNNDTIKIGEFKLVFNCETILSTAEPSLNAHIIDFKEQA